MSDHIACPKCGSSATVLHYASALQNGKPVGMYACLSCDERFIGAARTVADMGAVAASDFVARPALRP